MQTNIALEPLSPLSTELPSLLELRRTYSLSARAELGIRECRGRIRTRLSTGKGPTLVIVGPCSIHSEEAARAYAERLAPLQTRFEEDLIIVLRAYLEKPRTTRGWKGFLTDPRLDGSDELIEGVTRSRALLVELAEAGLCVATELLDPLLGRYIEDCVSWAAVGARTSESQIHRQAVSGLPFPVGFKNSTDGSIDIALHAIDAAAAPHTFVTVGDEGYLSLRRTNGNAATHIVLRGGKSGPNYEAKSLTEIGKALPSRIPLLIDCSHGNSQKRYERQLVVVDSICEQLSRSDVDILGAMIESHVEPGSQPVDPCASPYKSVTDACIGFEDTEKSLEKLARAARRR